MGSVHDTFESEGRIVQKLNPMFVVPPMEDVNKLVDHLIAGGIEAAHILAQDKTSRVMEKLEGEATTFHYSFEQSLKGIVFLAQLHYVLLNAEPIAAFKAVHEFSDSREQVIWGDINGGNIIWRNGEPVGVVDYDTASLGSRFYDIATACVLWPEVFSLNEARALFEAYQSVNPIEGDNFEEKLRHYTLLIYKKMQDAAAGRSHIKRPKEYFEGRLAKLDRTYAILCEAIV